MKEGALYLIPNGLGTYDQSIVTPQVKAIAPNIKVYITEHVKTARRFLKAADKATDIDSIEFYEINEIKDDIQKQMDILMEAKAGKDIGLISDAGMPSIADPGESVIRLAHEFFVQVIPLVGPSSLILALAASGLDAEKFSFHGYLPIKKPEREKRLKNLQSEIQRTGYTQMFIETPYRNHQMIESILKTCSNDLMLSVACNLTLENEWIQTKSIAKWRKTKLNIHKQPAVFLLGN